MIPVFKKSLGICLLLMLVVADFPRATAAERTGSAWLEQGNRFSLATLPGAVLVEQQLPQESGGDSFIAASNDLSKLSSPRQNPLTVSVQNNAVLRYQLQPRTSRGPPLSHC